MRQHQKMRRFSKTLIAGLITGGALLAQPALAQLSSATIRGQITQQGAPAKAPVQIVARNKSTGVVYHATTKADGSYVLVGLTPGSYDISVAGSKQGAQEVTVQVGETASVDLALSGATATLDRVQVVGSIQRKDVKTSEVGTSVSRAQIENLPQVTRNFLAFADLAPGVRFDVANNGQVTVRSGAQNQDNINVFIDGVGQKNYILRGGVSGLDSTRGNPFPQSAVAEYKVISQNYKAEFDQVSSAAITAVTKSGGNELHGDVFVDHTRSGWVGFDPWQKADAKNGVARPTFKQSQYGFDLGGPIKQDVAHFFMAFEGKDIGEPRQVVVRHADMLPNAGIVPSLLAMQGSSTSKFTEGLLLAKVDAQISDNQRVEFTGRLRREKDLVPEDKSFSAPGNEKNRTNDETRFDFKHEWTGNNMFNEARLGYEEYIWNPHSNATTPFIKYKVSATNDSHGMQDVLFVGGSPDAQRRKQSGYLVQDDLTYTALPGHTIKAGAKFKDMTFDLSGTFRSVDVIEKRIDVITGQPVTERTDLAVPAAGVKFSDKQFGIYLQDDWQVNKQLELNLGARWDYEDNALNNSYKTPADRVAALLGPDFTRQGITPPAGQTYAQALAKGGIRIEDYIATGSSRKAFTGAFQPRVGFSYDLKGDKSSVVFAGAGRAYDRAMANHALDELQKNAQPNGEVWLIKNDHKMPYTDQFALGLRQGLNAWNTEVGYTYSYSHNQFNWFAGDRDPNGGFGSRTNSIDPVWGAGPKGFGMLILGDFVTQQKTSTVYLKADKPYTRASGWGVSATYTLSDGKTTHRDWNNDIFNWTYGKPGGSGWNPSINVEEHRLVLAGLTDKLLPSGLMLSGKVTLGSGLPYRVTTCPVSWDACVSGKGHGDMFQQVDLGLSQDIAVGYGKFTLRLDVLNVFNTANYGGYDDWGGGPGNPQNKYGGDNANVGKPVPWKGMAGPMRTLKLTAKYSF